MASDFANTPDAELNPFQRVAKRTNDVVTPANALDAVGAVLFVDGMRRISNKHYASGIAELAVSRLIDVVDGKVARATGTATTKGEIVDASLDKAEVAALLIMGISKKLIPMKTVKRVAIQNGVNTVAAAVAKSAGNEIHPTKSGKHTMAIQNVEILGHFVSNSTDGFVSKATEAIAKTAGEAWQPLGIMASAQYVSDAVGQPGMASDLIEGANTAYEEAIIGARGLVREALATPGRLPV